MKKRTIIYLVALIAVLMSLMTISGCKMSRDADTELKDQQEQVMREATAQTGMPAIINFREKKILKDIYELRDQDGLTTYTYLISEMQGKPVFLFESIGYGIPYSTQYTNPMKPLSDMNVETTVIPQADPNALFSPESSEGTWIMAVDPSTKKVRVVYCEGRIIVSPFKL